MAPTGIPSCGGSAGADARITEKSWADRTLVRCVDVAGALAGMIVLSPLFLIVSGLVLFEDGWPVFFRQKRVGRNGIFFNILKFRTMRVTQVGPAITSAGDYRITRLGAMLRKYKLDELPQFICVLRGHMSLIGPRPEVPEYVEPDDQLWQIALKVRPGITNLAALAFRNEEELLAPADDPDAYYRATILPEKLRLDIEYQRTRSLFRDFKLLWLTVRYSFCPGGFDCDRILKSFST